MKVPDWCIDNLNTITKHICEYPINELFPTYRTLLNIQDAFRVYGVPVTDKKYQRLLDALIKMEIQIKYALEKYAMLEGKVEF